MEGRLMRRQFNLPENDADYLDSKGFQWETLLQGNFRWLIIQGYPIPTGYNVDNASIALRLDVHYPATQIDMAYFLPHLSKTNGRMIAAVTPLSIDDKNYQQWSRHRKPNAPWKPGEDDISTHLTMFNQILSIELTR
jgi:hypothetical protein